MVSCGDDIENNIEKKSEEKVVNGTDLLDHFMDLTLMIDSTKVSLNKKNTLPIIMTFEDLKELETELINYISTGKKILTTEDIALRNYITETHTRQIIIVYIENAFHYLNLVRNKLYGEAI